MANQTETNNADTSHFDPQLDLAINALMARSQLLEKLLDPRRNINTECGYPETGSITVEQYQELYDREALATRVVEVFPEESWAVQPKLYQTEDTNEVTDFEEAWSQLSPKTDGEDWMASDEETHPIWECLERIDKLSGIGHYGILLMGLDDGKSLAEPVEGLDETGKRVGNKNYQLTYLRAFPESLAPISTYELDPNNRRYGRPTMYNVTLNDPKNIIQGAAEPASTISVHWTRVVHFADNLGSSEVVGVPRMRPVYNRIHDLRKLYAGSSEMYWRGAFPGISLESHPQLGGDVELDEKAIQGKMRDYMNGLQRYFALTGAAAKSLAPQVVDPSPQIERQIEALCIKIGVPKRIFMGSERGELASGQDKNTWNGRLKRRQRNYLTPRVIRPFINRCIALGILPEPADGYRVKWPELETVSDKERAETSRVDTESLVKYVQGDVSTLIAERDFLTYWMGKTEEEADQILQNAVEAISDEEGLPKGHHDQDPVEDDDDNDEESTQNEVHVHGAHCNH